MSVLLERLKAARAVSVPIVAISTADQFACVQTIRRAINGAAPALQHDVIRGIQAINEAALSVVDQLCEGEKPELVTGNVVEALARAARLPERSMLFVLNAHRSLWDGDRVNLGVVQAIANLRDLFKQNQRLLILLAPSLRLPDELVHDVVMLDDLLPGPGELLAIVTELLESVEGVAIGETERVRAADILRGLSAFAAEQTLAMSLRKDGIDFGALVERRDKTIENTLGLSVDRSTMTLDDLGGLVAAKSFGQQVFEGEKPPRANLFIDEIEKSLAGAGGQGVGDTSGTSQDQLGVLLRCMEDYGWQGMILVGPPGSGKTAFGKALGRTFGVPTLVADLGAAKGSLVGQSEERIRAMMRTVYAVGAENVLVIATCNKLDALPPELQRRFTYGLRFFDLPDMGERDAIWALNLVRFGLSKSELPNDDGWTGAEIRNVCRLAADLRISLTDAARYIVPVSVSNPQAIERLRRQAAGAWISASTGDPYEDNHGRTV